MIRALWSNRNYNNRRFVVLVLVMILANHSSTQAFAFRPADASHTTAGSSSNSNSSTKLDAATNFDRDMNALESWATKQGVTKGKGFALSENSETGDWSVSVTQEGETAQEVLVVPEDLIFSSTSIRENDSEIYGDHLQDAIAYLDKKKCEAQVDQFLLWLKVLVEHEKGEDSRWHPWLNSLPKTFSNAVEMDEVELECLPPFAWSLAKVKILHCTEFQKAIQLIPKDKVVSQATRDNPELLQWAFNAVFTRCWGQDGDEEENRKDMVPMGDMFNHCHPGNVAILYDDDRNCHLILKEDVKPGDALTLSYGFETNPYRFMVVFGFVDESQEFIFSQLLSTKPTQKHVDMGYDVAKMTFSTIDGSFTEQVWDFVLYSLLEQVPEIQAAYYDAHVNKNQPQKDAIRRKYYLETCIMLKKHVDKMLAEVNELIAKVDSHDDQEHPHLPMIRKSNVFVAQTFAKAKRNVDQMIQQELIARKEQQQQQQQEQEQEQQEANKSTE